MTNSNEGYSAQDKNRTDSDKIRVQVLGSFSASLRQQIVTPTAGKQRQVFALLALRPGQVVTTSTLAEELWGSHPPPSFVVTLQTYIFQLRRRLAARTAHAIWYSVSKGSLTFVPDEHRLQPDAHDRGARLADGRPHQQELEGDHRLTLSGVADGRASATPTD